MASTTASHFLVFGGTSPTGLAFVEEALKLQHKLTLYVRNPSKLPDAIKTNPNVETVVGTLDEWDNVKKALPSDATILVSFLGPTLPGAADTPVTRFYQQLFPLIVEEGSSITRSFCCATPSYLAPGEKHSWLSWLMAGSVKLMFKTAFAEINGIGRVVSAQPVERVGWTIFRVPMLTNGEPLPVRTGTVKILNSGISLSRRSIAVWILQEVEEKKWVGKTPTLNNPGWF